MSELEIITDPSEEKMEEDIKKADIISVIHGCNNENDIKEAVKNFTEKSGLKIVYIHFYSKHKKYTMGVKIDGKTNF